MATKLISQRRIKLNREKVVQLRIIIRKKPSKSSSFKMIWNLARQQITPPKRSQRKKRVRRILRKMQ